MTAVEQYLASLEAWLRARAHGLTEDEERAWFEKLDAQWQALTEDQQGAVDQALAERD